MSLMSPALAGRFFTTSVIWDGHHPKNPKTINAGESMERIKLVQSVWKPVWRFLTKLKIELHYDPATLLLGIDPEKTLI